MSESLVKYLRQHQQPASALELALAVLHMKNIPESAAISIISSLLAGNEAVDRVSENTWIYKKSIASPLNEPGYLLCRALPAQCAHWREWLGFGCLLWSDGRITFRQTIAAMDRKEFNRDLATLLGKFNTLSPAFVILDGFGNQISLLASALADLLGEELEAPVFNIRKSAQSLFKGSVFQTPAQLAQHLGIRFYSDGDAAASLSDLQTLWEHFKARIEETGIIGADEPLGQLLQQTAPFDFSPYAFDADYIRLLPVSPGVYIMHDRAGCVIYIGKSKNLSRRLSSYFLPGIEADSKLTAIRSQLHSLDYQVMGSELEALLLEHELIRTLDPPINRQLQVRSRPHRRRGRYPRVVILPAVDSGFVRLFFLHPEHGLYHCWYGNGHSDAVAASVALWPNLPQTGTLVFSAEHVYDLVYDFLGGRVPASLELAELAYTWLGQNEDFINSIDLRVTDYKEGFLRVLEQYRMHVLVSGERIIPV